MELALKGLEQMLSRTVKEDAAAVRNREIVKELKELRLLLDANESRFNMAVDGDLVEACIFERNALNARINHLLRLAKETAVV